MIYLCVSKEPFCVDITEEKCRNCPFSSVEKRCKNFGVEKPLFFVIE